MNQISLKESLFLGFCAALLIITKAALRWHLGISGHAMFFTAFFLLLARGCVQFRGAASIAGLLAGMAAALLGMGKGGPLVISKFLLPALAVDLGALLLPWLFGSVLLCALVGAVAGASKFFGTAGLDLLIGMDPAIVWRHSLLEAVAAMAFGGIGAMGIPPVLRRLRAYSVLSPATNGRRQ
ncbi:hypothetical protein [Geopsychrobacter electrodiphilus]|uniref:hypothetical protein n=1 Tax=Geopsychrobacter electrodiphilus TaxID=225196 RepID=UPI0003786CA8|nr:hypothetical protein [Geopsychrobacter electrodiphilus]